MGVVCQVCARREARALGARAGGLHGGLNEVGRQISNLTRTGEVSAKALRRVRSRPGRGPHADQGLWASGRSDSADRLSRGRCGVFPAEEPLGWARSERSGAEADRPPGIPPC